MSGPMKVRSDIRLLRLPSGTNILQEAEEGTINLLGDDSPQIKLLMHYLYKAEQTPKLQASHAAHFRIEKALLQPKYKLSLTGKSNPHYEFPHTCSHSCLSANQRVC
jgi:hypothetical protein